MTSILPNNQFDALVLGVSNNPARTAYLAAFKLINAGYTVCLVGPRSEKVHDKPVVTRIPENIKVNTVTLYLNPQNQKAYYSDLVNLKPARIIFNPGTENPELIHLCKENGIKTEIACTLVLLASGQYES